MIPISQPLIGEEEKAAVLEVLDSGLLAQGKCVGELEKGFAELNGVEFAIATSSGTAALELALLAFEIGKGDEVITSPFTFIATVNSILHVGATPVFVDIETDTFNINTALIEKAISSRTKAIIPVHIYGQPCELVSIQELADRYQLALINDSAQAVGAKVHGRPIGSFGTSVFSLYATKNITSAEGGIITTDDERIARRCRLLRNHGAESKFHYVTSGYNYRMSELHASLALAQLDRLEQVTRIRQENAADLNSRIESVIIPVTREGVEHVWHHYTVRAKDISHRETAIHRLTQQGIGTGIYYPQPAHKVPHIRKIVGDLVIPVAERMSEEVFSLPVHPLVTKEQLHMIATEVNRLWR